jgi:hypothetical protein
VEDGRWIVTLAGYSHNYPPTHEAGFLEFAHRLGAPILYDLIRGAEPATPIHGFQRTENRLRHYERLTRFPEGLMALGDAACAFNPVYGQGMSVAVMEAQTLDGCLAERMLVAGDPDLHGLGGEFQRRLAGIIRTPWLIATGEDFRWPATVGGRPGRATRLLHRYMDNLLALAGDDIEVRTAFNAVSHLVSPALVLFSPPIMFKVAKHMLAHRAERPRRPSTDEPISANIHSASTD